jgi:hypothetical protein
MDTTIDNRLSLTQGDFRTGVSLSETEPWGSAGATLQTMAYLTTLRRQDVSVSPGLNVRITKGLSLSFGASFQLTRNQPYLMRTGLTEAEILTQEQQLATNYNYYLSVGLSYSFGSAFNNVVFPRFISGGVL